MGQMKKSIEQERSLASSDLLYDLLMEKKMYCKNHKCFGAVMFAVCIPNEAPRDGRPIGMIFFHDRVVEKLQKTFFVPHIFAYDLYTREEIGFCRWKERGNSELINCTGIFADAEKLEKLCSLTRNKRFAKEIKDFVADLFPEQMTEYYKERIDDVKDAVVTAIKWFFSIKALWLWILIITIIIIPFYIFMAFIMLGLAFTCCRGLMFFFFG